jgi:hypothetical protein
MKKIHCTSFLIITFICISQLTFASASVTPGQQTFENVSPGDTIEGSIEIGNAGNEPIDPIVEVSDFVDSKGIKQFVDYDTSRGLKKYLDTSFNPETLDPGESSTFAFTIDVPQDIAPGAYGAAVLASSKPADLEEGENVVGVTTRAVSFIYLEVEGEATEKAELISFDINEDMLSRGIVRFDIRVKNTGEARIYPTGEITIYDKEGNQIKGIYAVTEQFVDEEVVVERRNALPVNKTQLSIFPESEGTINVNWTNRNVDPGTYIAKLDLYYGEDNFLESETTFELQDKFYINSFAADSYFSSSLPVSFSASLNNAGSVTIAPAGYLDITNIFGFTKQRIDVAQQNLEIDAGEEQVLNMEWSNGLAYGFYNATLHLNVAGNNYSTSTSFWVLNIWQIIISVLVLIVLIFLVYKLIASYRKMKAKLDQIESKENKS